MFPRPHDIRPPVRSDRIHAVRPPQSIAVLIALALLCTGCGQEMANQPRAETLERSTFFDDGMASRPQVPGTIARGQTWEETPVTTGRQGGELIERIPLEVTAELLADGQRQFGIWCDHCHGPAGYGDGMVVRRGFPDPPSYHIERLRSVADGHLFRVITDGHGRMPDFRGRIPPRQRWAIISYIRALQLSQNAAPDALDPSDREQLSAGLE